MLHNSRAGGGRWRKRRLIGAFRRAGYDVTYYSLRKNRWQRALKGAADAIVAVGGDGAIASVAIELAKRHITTPLAVIPTGRANNIARAFGIHGPIRRLLAGLEKGTRTYLAIGSARGPWGRKQFVEAAGIGPIASLLTVELDSLRAAMSYVRRVVATTEPRAIRVRVDGKDLSGRYVLVYAMNIGRIGPRLELARNADPRDEKLDLVLVGATELPALNRYLARRAAGKQARCPLQAVRVRRVEIQPWPAQAGAHVDDKLWPYNARLSDGAVRIRIATRIPFLVPA